MAWVLKIAAIELRFVYSMGHMNKLEDLIKLFLYNNSSDILKSRKGSAMRKFINGGQYLLIYFLILNVQCFFKLRFSS